MSQTQSNEFMAFVAKGFETMEKHFVALAQRFEAMEQRFNGLEQRFNSLDERFDVLESRFDVLDSKVTVLQNNQDHILGQLKTLNEEKVVSSHRSQRMELWIEKAAKKINLPYRP